MPFIRLTTNRKLTLSQEIQIKEELGKAISLIPGKSEQTLMLHFEDNQIMYFRGQEGKTLMSCIYLYGKASTEAKESFAKEMARILEEITTVPIENQYAVFNEYDQWVMGGQLK